MYGMSPIETLAADAYVNNQIYMDSFIYSVTWLAGQTSALPASGQTETQLAINADSDFVVQELNLIAWSAAGTILDVPDYLLTITVAGSGRLLMNQSQPVLNMTGNYAPQHVPNRLVMPKLLPMNTTISNLLINRTAVAPNRVDLSFVGFKVFYNGQNNRGQIFHIL